MRPILLFCLVCGGLFGNQEREKPNVILVFIDDMGYADFSCYGNTQAETPYIDSLASEGLRFEQFYVNSPICSPSRVALSTGVFPARYKITSFLNDKAGNKKRGMADWLDPKAPMLARSLQRAGYFTGHFGKWHMGGGRDILNAPEITEYGFNAYLTNFEGIGNKLLGLTQKPGGPPKKTYFKGGEILGEPYKWVPRHEVTTGYVDAAIEHIEKSKSLQKPFYVNVWPDDVHSPFYPSPEKWEDHLKGRYMAVLEEMDEQLGKLFTYVRNDEELRENTIILITNDNGPSAGLHAKMPFKGYKTYVYEGGIRSPLIVWAPQLLPTEVKGTVNKNSVFSAVDLVPSLIELCGAELEQEAYYDGEQLARTLVGKSQDSREAPLYFSRPTDAVFKEVYRVKNAPELAVREGKWKLLCNTDGSNTQLYNLEADRMEARNVVKDHVKEVTLLKEKLLNWHREVSE